MFLKPLKTQNPGDNVDYMVIQTSGGLPDHLTSGRGRDRVAKFAYPWDSSGTLLCLISN